MTDPVAASLAALQRFGREAGRAAWLEITADQGEWSGGVFPDATFPAASLLKLPLAMATEDSLRDLDPTVTVAIAEVLDSDDVSVLWALAPDQRLAHAELLRLMISASDNACARYLLGHTPLTGITRAIRLANCTATTIEMTEDAAGRPSLQGSTTARDAVQLLKAASDVNRFPMTAFALTHSVRNSRIPLGATEEDVEVAHKTGTLPGLAHDVAVIRGHRGELFAAFLSDEQHDLLVTGYEMGICTRTVLQAWELSAHKTISAVANP